MWRYDQLERKIKKGTATRKEIRAFKHRAKAEKDGKLTSVGYQRKNSNTLVSVVPVCIVSEQHRWVWKRPDGSIFDYIQ